MIQLFSALIYNANLGGFFKGQIYQGSVKGICVPGLNCYSCPGAVGSCPLGALQSSLNGIRYTFPFYIVGTLLLFGVLLGRTVCGFLCPFGLIQDLLYKIPTGKIKKGRWSRALSYLKYLILGVFVLYIPLYTALANGVVLPAFCKYICPVGTLEGGIPLVLMNEQLRSLTGALFNWKVFLLLAVLTASVFIYRPFCRFLCPLGAIYSIFHRVSIFGYRRDDRKCTGCDACVAFCKMDVKSVGDRECIRCGACKDVCEAGAVVWRPKLGEKRENAGDACEKR